jgi:hypothetical protein
VYDKELDDYVYSTRCATMVKINMIGAERIYPGIKISKAYLADGWTRKDFDPKNPSWKHKDQRWQGRNQIRANPLSCEFGPNQTAQPESVYTSIKLSAGALAMPPFLYSCPNTGQNVQGFTAEEASGDAYEAVTCLACRQSHFVKPTAGKVLGEDDEE